MATGHSAGNRLRTVRQTWNSHWAERHVTFRLGTAFCETRYQCSTAPGPRCSGRQPVGQPGIYSAWPACCHQRHHQSALGGRTQKRRENRSHQSRYFGEEGRDRSQRQAGKEIIAELKELMANELAAKE